MGRKPLGVAGVVLTLAVVAQSTTAAGQVPLVPIRASGQSVTPAFEGWYKNPGWEDRPVDETAHCWIDVTHLDQTDFDQLVAARKTRATGAKQ